MRPEEPVLVFSRFSLVNLLLVSARVLLLVVVKLCSTQTLYRFTLPAPVANCRVHSVTSHQGDKYLSYLISYACQETET